MRDWYMHTSIYAYIDGLVQDCSNSSALAMELLQSCTKPSIYAIDVSDIHNGLHIIISFQIILHSKISIL